MKVILALALLAGLALLPFVIVRRPWALRLWGKLKFAIVAYILVIVALAIFRLVLDWDAIYG